MDSRLIAALLCLGLIAVVRADPNRPLGLDLYRPVPRDNPVTLEKVKLGRLLFRDRLLSRDRSLSCSDCHRRKQAFTDGRAKAVGVYGRQGPRSVPTLVNRAWGQSFFWDGRIRTLEEQVVQPILAKLEMDLTLEEAVERLRKKRRYRKDFQAVFDRAVNGEDLAKALATYVRTIQSGDSPYDRYVLGENDALSESALEGLKLFRGKANCTVCHAGPTLSDEGFHNTGVAWRDGKYLDDGRYAVTKEEGARGKFKTPTLREIARTAPYMHDGSIPTLEEVIDFYSDGGRENPNRDPEVQRLNLTDRERADLVSFLHALSGDIQVGR